MRLGRRRALRRARRRLSVAARPEPDVAGPQLALDRDRQERLAAPEPAAAVPAASCSSPASTDVEHAVKTRRAGRRGPVDSGERAAPTASGASIRSVEASSLSATDEPHLTQPAPSSLSTFRVGLGINVSRPIRRDSLSPTTTATPRPLSFSPYPSPPFPSPAPSSPNLSRYSFASTRTSSDVQKPLPPLPVASGSPTSPRFRRLPPTPPPEHAVRKALARHSSARSPTRNVETAFDAPLVESPVDMHASSLRPPPPSPSSPPHAPFPPRRRTRTRTTSSTSSTSRSSLDLGNITADLSELAESFGRAGPSVGPAGGRGGELDARAGRAAEEGKDEAQQGGEDEDEEEERALVRRVRSTIELQRRKASVASSSGGRSGRGSVASEAGSALTTGGYRVRRCRFSPSFSPPLSCALTPSSTPAGLQAHAPLVLPPLLADNDPPQPHDLVDELALVVDVGLGGGRAL